jgi:predicted SAM-dependent methyltransferase
MLKECHRVLRPGGKIRISTPNLQAILSLAESNKNPVQQAYIKMASDKYIPENRDYQASLVINNFFWDFGHHLVYDAQTLEASLATAGFVQITAMKPGKSDDPQITGVEHHGQVIGDELNQFETMVFEAVKR